MSREERATERARTLGAVCRAVAYLENTEQCWSSTQGHHTRTVEKPWAMHFFNTLGNEVLMYHFDVPDYGGWLEFPECDDGRPWFQPWKDKLRDWRNI